MFLPRQALRPFARFAALAAAIAILLPFPAPAEDPVAEPSPEQREANALATLEKMAAEGFAKHRFPGLAFGFVRGQELVLAKGYGVANIETGDPVAPTTPFQIGSISKVFTTSLLLSLRDDGLVRLDDPVSLYLPEGAAMPPVDPRGAPAITLRHLATHTSGLPSLPPNLTGTDVDPYNGYTEEQLLAGLPTIPRPDRVGAWFGYSNLGNGLLGYALGRADGAGYEAALRKRILDPLGMSATKYGTEHAALGGTRGHQDEAGGLLNLSGGKFATIPDWNLGVLGPAGAIVSNVEDMAKFLALHLREATADSAVLSGGTLAEAHEPQRLANGWEQAIGLGWMIDKVGPKQGAPAGVDRVVWHNGGMSGYVSWMGFVPGAKVGVILLANHGDRRAVDEFGKELLLFAAKELPMPPEAAPARVREVVERLSACFSQAPSIETLQELLHPDFQAQVSAAQIGMVFLSVFYHQGACERWEVERAAADPNYFVARFHMANGEGEPVKLILGFDDEESEEGKIVFAFFPPPKGADESD